MGTSSDYIQTIKTECFFCRTELVIEESSLCPVIPITSCNICYNKIVELNPDIDIENMSFVDIKNDASIIKE